MILAQCFMPQNTNTESLQITVISFLALPAIVKTLVLPRELDALKCGNTSLLHSRTITTLMMMLMMMMTTKMAERL